VNTAVLELVPHLAAEHKRLLLGPPQDAREQRQRQALEALVDVVVAPRANLLVVLVGRPRVEGPLELGACDVHETGLAHPLLELVTLDHGPVDGLARVLEELAVARNVAVLGKGAVVGSVRQLDLLELDVAARLEVVARLAHKVLVRHEAAGEDAGEDEVERRVPRPLFLKVVGLEGDVGRDPVCVRGA
jgi:hypothetical protein